MNFNNVFKFVFIILILSFSFLMIASKSGYYEYELSRENNLTEEAIKRFETDVLEGKSIDIKNYVGDTTNYKNFYSNLGYNLSVGVDNVLNKGLKKVGDILKKLLHMKNSGKRKEEYNV